MAALYAPIQLHALASAKVRALDPDAFVAQVMKAEMLLGLKAPALTDSAAVERLHLALIEQVNFQIQQGIDPLIEEASSSSHSRSSVTWRDRIISPIAQQIVDEVVIETAAGAWIGMVSHRSPDVARTARAIGERGLLP